MPDNEKNNTDHTDELAPIEVYAAMRSGFLQLDAPAAAPGMEGRLRGMLTSGRDFDPWHRQIARRIAWTAVPAVIVFAAASGFLMLRPVPRMPITEWMLRRKGDYRPPTPKLDGKVYAQLPVLNGTVDEAVADSANLDLAYSNRNRVNGWLLFDDDSVERAPEWFRKVRKKNPPIPKGAVMMQQQPGGSVQRGSVPPGSHQAMTAGGFMLRTSPGATTPAMQGSLRPTAGVHAPSAITGSKVMGK